LLLFSQMAEESNNFSRSRYEEVIRAVESGDNKAKAVLGSFKLGGLGGAEIDKNGAADLFSSCCETDTEAMWKLGLCYEFGMGREKDVAKAKALYVQSREGGNVVGKFLAEKDDDKRGSGRMVMGKIGEEMMERLYELISIAPWTKLDFEGSGIGEKGGIILSEVLKHNTSLTELNLRYNNISDYGGRMIREALIVNTTLTTLALGGNLLEKVAYFLDTHLKNVMVCEMHPSREEWRLFNRKLRLLDQFEKFSYRNHNIRDEGARDMSEWLKLSTTLRSLDLGKNNIGAAGARMISEALKTNTTLTELYLDRNNIGDSGARMISEALKTNTILTYLYLSANHIGDSGARMISDSLKTNTTLTELGLSGNSIGETGARKISKALKTNTTLTKLDLYDNNIGESGARMISEALKTNTSLTKLSLSGSTIGDEGKAALRSSWGSRSPLVNLVLEDQEVSPSTWFFDED